MTTRDEAGHETPVDERLNQLFVGLGRLSETDLLLLRSYWDEMDPEARKAAWQAAMQIVRDTNREAMLDEGRRRIAHWVNDYESAYWQGPVGGGDGFPASSVRDAAIPPLMDAVVATITSDTLDDGVAQALYGPLSRLYDQEPTE